MRLTLLAVILGILASCSTSPSLRPLRTSDEVYVLGGLQPKNLGEVFYHQWAEPQLNVIELLETCTTQSCKNSEEKQKAEKLRRMHVALRKSDSSQIHILSLSLVEDFRQLFETYSSQSKYEIPLLYEAWFQAGALYPYTKTISEALFDEVKERLGKMEVRETKPEGYFGFIALSTEYGDTASSEKAMAYRRCLDLHPHLKRCQEGWLRWSQAYVRPTGAKKNTFPKTALIKSELPKNEPIKTEAQKCESRIKTDSVTIYLADKQKSQDFPIGKPFEGEKLFHTRSPLLRPRDIAEIHLNPDGQSATIEVKPQVQSTLTKRLKTNAKHQWVMVRQELVYGMGPVKVSDSERIYLSHIDEKGFKQLSTACP